MVYAMIIAVVCLLLVILLAVVAYVALRRSSSGTLSTGAPNAPAADSVNTSINTALAPSAGAPAATVAPVTAAPYIAPASAIGRVLTGTATANNSPAYVTVAFPVAFSTIPVVTMTFISQSSTPVLGTYVATVSNVTTTSFQFYATYIKNGVGATGQVFGSGDVFGWLAVSTA